MATTQTGRTTRPAPGNCANASAAALHTEFAFTRATADAEVAGTFAAERQVSAASSEPEASAVTPDSTALAYESLGGAQELDCASARPPKAHRSAAKTNFTLIDMV
jgi:hypothetical protein